MTSTTDTPGRVDPRPPFHARPLGGPPAERLARLTPVVDALRETDAAAERDRVLQYDAVAAIRETFELSSTRYYQILNALLDDPAALAHDPLLIRRLRRLRERRQRARSARRLGIELND